MPARLIRRPARPWGPGYAIAACAGCAFHFEGHPNDAFSVMMQHNLDYHPEYCSGCGQSFKGARGLRAHQSRRFSSMECYNMQVNWFSLKPSNA